MDVRWEYTRVTSRSSYTHAVTEEVTEDPSVSSVALKATTPVSFSSDGVIKFYAQFSAPSGDPLAGEKLYVVGLLKAPGGRVFRIAARDDGIGVDNKANDGWFSGELDLNWAQEYTSGSVQGIWKIYAVAQNVNLANVDDPLEASKHIGGVIVASPIGLKFGGGECPVVDGVEVEVVA